MARIGLDTARTSRTNHRVRIIKSQRQTTYANLVLFYGNFSLFNALDLFIIVLVRGSEARYITNRVGRYDSVLFWQTRLADQRPTLKFVLAGQLDERNVIRGELVSARVFFILWVNEHAHVLDLLVVVTLGVVEAVEQENARIGPISETMSGRNYPMFVE